MTEEFLLELVKSIPTLVVLVYWIYTEKQSHREDVAYYRGRNEMLFDTLITALSIAATSKPYTPETPPRIGGIVFPKKEAEQPVA